MDWKKLFEAQLIHDNQVEAKYPSKEGEDRYKKRILGLMVQVGECANLWQGYKFWSSDQEPITSEEEICSWCDGTCVGSCGWKCEECHEGYVISSNPLLEEYVNCLRFIISIGNQINFSNIIFEEQHIYKEKTIEDQFYKLLYYAVLMQDNHIICYIALFHSFIHLGVMLGFSEEEIKQVYFEKSTTND